MPAGLRKHPIRCQLLIELLLRHLASERGGGCAARVLHRVALPTGPASSLPPPERRLLQPVRVVSGKEVGAASEPGRAASSASAGPGIGCAICIGCGSQLLREVGEKTHPPSATRTVFAELIQVGAESVFVHSALAYNRARVRRGLRSVAGVDNAAVQGAGRV